MRSLYDAETDALYVRLAEAPVVGSEEIRPGLILDASKHPSPDAGLRHATAA